jgi:hypothetical protein
MRSARPVVVCSYSRITGHASLPQKTVKGGSIRANAPATHRSCRGSRQACRNDTTTTLQPAAFALARPLRYRLRSARAAFLPEADIRSEIGNTCSRGTSGGGLSQNRL